MNKDKVGAVRSIHGAKYWTGMGRPCLNCTGRTGLNNYVTGVVVVVGPWGLDEWTNWKELNKWGVKE